MPSFVQHTIRNNSFVLHSNRSIFWEDTKALILSDLHIGKTGHFRKHGIAVPTAVTKEDMQRLVIAIQYFKPSKLIIIGDLFHSVENKEHDWFVKWRKDFPRVEFVLVKGNHDIAEDNWYRDAGINSVPQITSFEGFSFIHSAEDFDFENNTDYVFSGHVHPAVRISGPGRQSLKLPCFYFTEKYSVLPAFGKFTGNFLIKPSNNEFVFAVTNNQVIRINKD